MATKFDFTVTKLTFILGMLCLIGIGYCSIAYIHLSFSAVPENTAWAVIRQRTALSALAIVTGISCIVMGFATFMIGAKGEIKFDSQSDWVKGSLSTTVPGPFFVLCGTVICVCVILSKVSHEETTSPEPAPTATKGNQEPSSVKAKTEEINGRPSIPNKTASRTIASPEETEGLFIRNQSAFQSLRDLANNDVQPAVTDTFVKTMMTVGAFDIVLVEWDYAQNKPKKNTFRMKKNPNISIALDEGFLVVSGSELPELVQAMYTIRMYGGGGADALKRIDWKPCLAAIRPVLKYAVFVDGTKTTR